MLIERAKNCCTTCTTTAPRCKKVLVHLYNVHRTAPRVYRRGAVVQWCRSKGAISAIKSAFTHPWSDRRISACSQEFAGAAS